MDKTKDLKSSSGCEKKKERERAKEQIDSQWVEEAVQRADRVIRAL